MYSCQVCNEAGQVKSAAELLVKGWTILLFGPSSSLFNLFSPFSQLFFLLIFSPGISLLSSNSPFSFLYSDSNLIFRKYKMVSDGSSATLHIMKLEQDDAGLYECRVSNNVGSETCHSTISLKGWFRITDRFLKALSQCEDLSSPLIFPSLDGDNRKITFENNVVTLVVPRADSTSAGRYTCQLRNDQSIFYNVSGSVRIRDNTALEVKVSGSPELKTKCADKYDVSFENNTAVLSVRASSSSDGGVYTCTASNEAGQAPENIIILLLFCSLSVPPTIEVDVKLIEGLVVKAGAAIALPAKMTGIPIPTARWVTDDKEITSEGRYHIETAGSSTILSIPESQRGDTGEYILTVTNPAGSKTVALHVTVLDIPGPPIKLDGTIVVKAGDSIPIEATVKGKPQPDVKWTRDESTKEIRKGPRLQIETGADFSKLLITGARRTDTGKYVVTASNSAGTSSAHAKLNVLDRPGPINDLKVSGITIDRCHLAWEVPEDNGGCDIYNYIIEKCETKRGVWSVHSNAVITNKANVTRLIEGNEYVFRVRAENKMGPGPAVESESIVAGTQFSVPDAPEAPEVTKIAKEEMTVQWSEPERDGGKPITGYLLEKREEHAVRWSPVNKDPIPTTRFTVTGLLPLHDYQYRVKAVNEIGNGSPSKPSCAITAKDTVGAMCSECQLRTRWA
uniref:Titin n=1 Tax=Cyclopterus lumpus TaxID=8103 RepID=A0A8C2ZNV2_CYCLU